MPQPPGYLFREPEDRSRRKGAAGFQRSPLTPEPILVDNAPVELYPGAHGPADQIRFSDISRGAVRRIVAFFGPPRHDQWPHDVEASVKFQRSLEGDRPQTARIVRGRQYPHPVQTGKARTDLAIDETPEIIEGSF
jgi:hypothetical protein